MIFVTLMLNNVPGMWRAGLLAITSTSHAGGDGASLGVCVCALAYTIAY